jgi:hypothetical protein
LNRWLTGVRRIFSEEHLAYRINDQGGVRFAIDEDFDATNVATIAALGDDRYKAALASFVDAQRSASATPPRWKDAIRYAFDAVEGLFRLMFPKAARLGGDEVNQHLAPIAAKSWRRTPQPSVPPKNSSDPSRSGLTLLTSIDMQPVSLSRASRPKSWRSC